MTNQSFDAVRDAVAKSLGEHWKLFLIEGIILVVLGVLAVIVPPLASLAVTVLFGWLFLISGIIGLITTFAMRQAPGFWWSLVSAIIAIVAGGLLLAQPIQGMLTLTFVLIAFFIIEGVATIMFALEHKRSLSGRWGWMLVSGIVDLFLAAIILIGLPGAAAWALGLIVGINLVFGGTSLIAMALAARSQMP
ncbi:MAG: HdeD family acid-resistance protein [Xanthobacteraceae bacterium]